jgi:transposase
VLRGGTQYCVVRPHATSAGRYTCRLHSFDPELYLDEVLRVLPYWPQERYLELAPKSWRPPAPSAVLVGSFTIPAA